MRIRSLTMTYFHRRGAYYHWRGSVSPSCSGWEGVVPLCYGRQTKGWGSRCLSGPRIRIVWGAALTRRFCRRWKKVFGLKRIVLSHCTASQNYRVKPHGQLVLVSLTHYCASTPSLSTSWSSTTLQGDRVSREDLSSGEFHA